VLGWVSALGSKHTLNVPLSVGISYLCLSTSTVESVDGKVEWCAVALTSRLELMYARPSNLNMYTLRFTNSAPDLCYAV
jgi:hypothetical protein